MGDIINPYIAGAPVTEQRMFFGREDIFQWIENSVAGQYADHILVVHGQRRVGKTSVLKQLGNRLPKRYIPVFFDLQGRTHTTLDRFLWWLAREIVRALKQERGIEIALPEKEAFSADLEYFENQFLPGLHPALDGNILLLTFDEFDNLEEGEIKESLGRPLIDYLRRMMGNTDLNFIFSIGSSGRKLENMQASYTDFFKTALYKKISFLNEEQTHNLITRPVDRVIEYERAAVERIYEISSGHPYFTQLTCHELFARCQRTEQRKIAKDDVEAILDDVVERGTVNLKFVWDEATDIEKWSLAALAYLGKTDTRAIADHLRKHRVRFSESDLTSGLLHLREKDVLTPENRFVIHLLKRWLQKNRPIEQVREELTEVNPIANRYIEIGLEYKDAKLYDKAINSFQEALGIARENIQAQVNIALTYMDQILYDKAVVEFEKALAMDDEDVVARTGLCEAHLALGDAAMTRGRTKEAVLSYQRVLGINSEHTEARGRMAELSRQRAEKALTNGRDEEALGAFSEALKYTPEDASLIARVDKVRAEKNAKVLAAQVARSEKEAALRNWDKAIAALNEALETAPGDESILKKLAGIKEKQLQERLDAILLKVDAAEKAGRWDGAISGLNEYLQLKPDDPIIQKRIADLVETKHTAWMKAVMQRVDRAVAAQNWDEALTALNEALRLEPDNPEMRAKAEEVREARRIAELEFMLQRAGQAANAQRWDEAVDILNNGLASDPDNETLKTKLAEARKSKREARLQAALRLADSAAGAGKWDTAAASLQEVLANEPDNPEFIQKLTEIKRLERESRLEGLETLAQSLLKAEKFEESLTAWNEYLALLPADREKAQAEIEAVKKAQTLAALYAEGTNAYAKKNYEKAIDLFKRIVVEDTEYKDATDLLAESVRLRRAGQKSPRVFNRKAWMTGGLLAVLALGIGGGLFWLGKNGLTMLPAPMENNIAAPSSTMLPAQITDNTATPTSTATRAAPTLTPTPALDPAIQAALDTIQNEEPLYQTSFDDWESWDSHGITEIENGKLIVASENQQHAGVDLYNLISDKYAVQFDLRVLDISPEGHCIFETTNDADSETSSWRAMSAGFFSDGHAILDYIHPDRYDDFEGAIEEAIGEYDLAKSNAVTLIILGDKIAAFIDGNLVYTAMDPDGSAVFARQALSANYTARCEYDNFKIWDLSELDPAVRAALAAIQREEPLYQTSFDSWDFGNPVENAKVENGKLIVSNDSEINTYVPLNNFNFNSTRFAVEFETQILESLDDASCSLGISNDDTNFRVIFWPGGNIQVDRPRFPNDLIIGSGRFDPSISNTVMLIVLDDQFSLFINGEMSFTALDPEGSAVYTSGLFEASSPITCEFDNYKIWDLSGVDFSATTGTTTTGTTSSFASILDSIADKTPDFEDDFSNLTSGWQTDRNSTGNEVGYQDGAYLISAKDTCYGAGLPTNQVFSDFVLEMDVKFITQGQGTMTIFFRDNGTAHYGANLSPQGWFNFHKNVNNVHIPLLETEVPASSFQAWDTPKHLTLVARQDRMALYVNGKLVIALADTSSSQGGLQFGACVDSPLQVLIDNLKIWDITNLSP